MDLHEGDITGDLGGLETVARVAQDISHRPGGVLDGLVANANASMTGQVIFADGGYDVVARGDDIWKSV